MKTLNHNQLAELIANTSGAVIVGLLALTDTKARKTGMTNDRHGLRMVANPFGTIFKQVRAVGFCGADYTNAVKREAIRQDTGADTFQGNVLPWGEWLVPNKVITHYGTLYLRTQTTPNQRRNQPAKLLCYRDATGKFLARDDVKPFLPERKESAKQQAHGLHDTVWVRVYRFDSLQRVRILGQTYLIKSN